MSTAKGVRLDDAGRAMKIDVTGAGVSLTEVLREKVVRRVLLAVSRFGPQVRKVKVCLAEPVNPLGGVDQQCRMRARLQEGDDIHAEAIDGGFESAVARAAAQLAQRMDTATHRAGDGAIAPPGAQHRPPLRSRR